MTNPKTISLNPVKASDIYGTITMEGKAISFREFLNGMEGFDKDCGLIMDAAVEGKLDWVDVENYLCPIVDKLLADSVEIEHDIYFDLMNSIEKAYNEFISRKVMRELKEAEALPFIYFDVKQGGPDMAKRFEEIAEHIRNGHTLERVEDNVENDGHYYFTLIKPTKDPSDES
jgi:hypothetical protein